MSALSPGSRATYPLRFDRRALLRGGLASFLAAGLAACGGTTSTPTRPAQTTATQVPQPSPTTVPGVGSVSSPTSVPATATPVATPRTSPVAVNSPSAPTAVSRPSGWRRLEPAADGPSPRRDHSLVADARGEAVYLFGGRSERGPLGDLWRYDVEANRWAGLTPGGDRPAARFGHNAAFDPVTGRVLIFGGQAGPNFFNDVWAFDIAGGRWSRLIAGGLPQPRYGAGSGFDPAARAFYVSHGFTDQGRFDDSWALTLDTSWKKITPMSGQLPEKRCLHRSLADPQRRRLLLFGGQSNSAPFLGDLWALDLGGAWRQLQPAGPNPSPRNLYSLVEADGTSAALLFGGNTSAGKNGELWLLDLARDGWRQLSGDIPGQPPDPRDSHDATWLAGRRSMLLFGGRSGADLNDLWELTLDDRLLGAS